MWPMGLFLIENELGKRFNNNMMDLSSTKLVFINILHKSVSINSDIFFYMEFFFVRCWARLPANFRCCAGTERSSPKKSSFS